MVGETLHGYTVEARAVAVVVDVQRRGRGHEEARLRHELLGGEERKLVGEARLPLSNPRRVRASSCAAECGARGCGGGAAPSRPGAADAARTAPRGASPCDSLSTASTDLEFVPAVHSPIDRPVDGPLSLSERRAYVQEV